MTASLTHDTWTPMPRWRVHLAGTFAGGRSLVPARTAEEAEEKIDEMLRVLPYSRKGMKRETMLADRIQRGKTELVYPTEAEGCIS